MIHEVMEVSRDTIKAAVPTPNKRHHKALVASITVNKLHLNLYRETD